MSNLTLGEFIRILQLRDPREHVMYDFGSLRPGEFDSYRGFYEDLALSFDGPWDVTVQSLLEKCQNAIGETFVGYKGGHYICTPAKSLWAASHGNTGSTAIVGLHECTYMTVIKTEWID